MSKYVKEDEYAKTTICGNLGPYSTTLLDGPRLPDCY